MFAITSEGKTEPLSHFIKESYELFEEKNGPLTLSFTSLDVEENPGHQLLKEESIIEVEDGRKFVVKDLTEVLDQKSITAMSIFFDLDGHYKHDTYGGTRTFDQFATWLFAGTGWTYESVDVTGSKLIPNYGDENFLVLHEVLISTFDCEREIRPNNHVVFKKRLGTDRDAQYRLGHNIRALSRKVNTDDLKTTIRGYGGNGLEILYTSPNAAVFPGQREAKPVRDERFTIASSLTERVKEDLVDYPKVAIELDATELMEKEIGEPVWLIYEYKTTDLEFQTRILAKTTRIPAERSSAVIGNAMPKTLTDSLTETNVTIDENAKQSNSRFEQTNEKIEMAVEQIGGEVDEAKAAWTIEALAIRGDVTLLRTYTDDELGVVKEDASANFDILAGSITQAVSTNKTYTDNLGTAIRQENSSNFNVLSGRINAKAESSTVSALGTRVNTVEWNMDAVSGSISQMVTEADLNGNFLVSKINQTATTIDINASRINLVGAVTVLSDLTGNLGNITAGNITGTNFTLGSNGLLDLRNGTILWGTNVPGNVLYAANAGNANMLNGQYTYRDFSFNGHSHGNDFVHSNVGQNIRLHRDVGNGRLSVTVDGVHRGQLAWY